MIRSNDQKTKIIGGINLSKQAMEEFEGASRSKIFMDGLWLIRQNVGRGIKEVVILIRGIEGPNAPLVR